MIKKKAPTTMPDIQYFTKEGLDKLKAEVHHMKTVERPAISRQIAEARDKGDLSENAEYDAAKEAQGLLEAKIAETETMLASARLLDESLIDNSRVMILSKVTLKNLKNNAKITYTLVTEKEADLKSGRISVKSPIGAGLIGKKVGETVQIQAPVGIIEFEVLEIGR
jgi:transcription elongation factor GreA